MKNLLPILFLLLVLPFCSPEKTMPEKNNNPVYQKLLFLPSGLTIMAAKADTEEKRQKGLMDRSHLAETEGMIFSFDHTAFHAFWMFRTLIPLSIIFVDEDGTVVDVRHMRPCPDTAPEKCPVYTARRPSRFAIEINQEVCRKYGITPGDRVVFQ